jgi:pyruvate dehydrogenase E2 component (dihydrolipoamide acetyltransferase)
VPSVINMPAVAAGATEVVLAEWSVEEGASFGPRDAYAVIETDKATVDLEHDSDAVLLRRLVPAGATVGIGAPIALVAAPGEEVPDLEAALAAAGVRTAAAAPAKAPATAPETSEPSAAPEAPAAPEPGRVFTSPLARRLAREAGLDLAGLRGTGPRNRILRRDVERAVAARSEHRDTTAELETAESGTAESEAVPHTRVRRAVARRLVASTQEVPHFRVRGSARVDQLLDLRREVRDAGLEVSLNDLVVRAVARAHRAVPEMNVVWSQDAVAQHTRVDVGIAAATERGLLTPVVRDVADRPLREVVKDTRNLLERARTGRLTQDELEGGTVSVSNLGMYGIEDFDAIINPPQSSILAVGGVREEVVVEDGTPAVGRVLRFTLSVDHRPLDGAVAARWMRAFTDLVEAPAGILL